jgi:hypothetical protein
MYLYQVGVISDKIHILPMTEYKAAYYYIRIKLNDGNTSKIFFFPRKVVAILSELLQPSLISNI